MSTKQEVLKILEQNRMEHYSGEKLANSLNLSRSAVHKSIKELRQDGYIINAISNKGYKLGEENDIISVEGIKTYLNDADKYEIFVYKTLESTNQKAKMMALDGGKHGSVIIANEQSDGRGRMGRSFFSPADTGIYMSILLRPKVTAQQGMLITTCAAVSVCRAIDKMFSVSPTVKWVNDIILNGRKICGILTEAVTDFETSNLESVILGIGINFSTENFPEDLKLKAGALSDLEGSPKFRNRLIAEIINELFENFKDMGKGRFMDEYRERSLVIGSEIEIIRNDKKEKVKAMDIDSMGGLVVEHVGGRMETLTSGEISVLGDFYNG